MIFLRLAALDHVHVDRLLEEQAEVEEGDREAAGAVGEQRVIGAKADLAPFLVIDLLHDFGRRVRRRRRRAPCAFSRACALRRSIGKGRRLAVGQPVRRRRPRLRRSSRARPRRRRRPSTRCGDQDCPTCRSFSLAQSEQGNDVSLRIRPIRQLRGPRHGSSADKCQIGRSPAGGARLGFVAGRRPAVPRQAPVVGVLAPAIEIRRIEKAARASSRRNRRCRWRSAPRARPRGARELGDSLGAKRRAACCGGASARGRDRG